MKFINPKISPVYSVLLLICRCLKFMSFTARDYKLLVITAVVLPVVAKIYIRLPLVNMDDEIFPDTNSLAYDCQLLVA
jgi:hypothetical protein